MDKYFLLFHKFNYFQTATTTLIMARRRIQSSWMDESDSDADDPPPQVFSSRHDSLSVGAEIETGRQTPGSSQDISTQLVDNGQSANTTENNPSSPNLNQLQDNEANEISDSGSGLSSDEENNNDDLESREEQSRKRKAESISPVWMCAVKLSKSEAKCKICKGVFAMSRGGTSNIRQHLQAVHPANKDVQNMLKAIAEKKKRDDANKKKKKKAESDGTQSSIKTFVSSSGIDPKKKTIINAKLLQFIIAEKLPFSLVESPFFRELLFALESGYIAPSRRTFVEMFDGFAEDLPKILGRQFEKDQANFEMKVWTITSDHGTSSDVNKSKLNAITVSRTTDSFDIKTDTVDLVICNESQTGYNIRKAVKESLIKVGYREGHLINWITDGAPNQVSKITGCPIKTDLQRRLYFCKCQFYLLHLQYRT